MAFKGTSGKIYGEPCLKALEELIEGINYSFKKREEQILSVLVEKKDGVIIYIDYQRCIFDDGTILHCNLKPQNNHQKVVEMTAGALKTLMEIQSSNNFI